MKLNIFPYRFMLPLNGAVLALIIGSSSSIFAQGICVISEKTLAEFKGVVRQEDKQVIPGALIKVHKQIYEKKPVAEIKTDADGYFKLSNLPNGKYSVNVSYPNFVTLVFPVRIFKKTDKPNQQLIVVPGWNYNKPCGGGEVSTISTTAPTSEEKSDLTSKSPGSVSTDYIRKSIKADSEKRPPFSQQNNSANSVEKKPERR